MVSEVQKSSAPTQPVEVALPGGAPATTTAQPPMHRAPAGASDGLVITKAPAAASAKSAPDFNEKIADMPVIGRIYSAYKLAQVSLFADLRVTPNDPPPNNGPVMTVFKTVIGVPVMTIGFLIAAAFTGRDK